MKFDRGRLYLGFSAFYTKAFRTSFSEQHRKNLNFLITMVEQDKRWTDLRQVAYFFTTIVWETAKTLAPIKEYRAKVGSRARSLQDKYWDTGFYGRGYVQLTHKYNYEKISKVLHVDLLENPDLMLTPQISYNAAAHGMLRGLFTGKKLDNYINSDQCDYQNARKIINGLDRAEELADYAQEIEKIIKAAVIKDTVTMAVSEEEFNTLAPAPELEEAQPIAQDIEYIDRHSVEKPRGWRTWKTTITTTISSLGVSIASVWGWITEKASDPDTARIFLIAAIVLVVLGLTSLIFYLIYRNKLLIAREKMAHETTLKELEIRANPALKNVEVQKVK